MMLADRNLLRLFWGQWKNPQVSKNGVNSSFSLRILLLKSWILHNKPIYQKQQNRSFVSAVSNNNHDHCWSGEKKNSLILFLVLLPFGYMKEGRLSWLRTEPRCKMWPRFHAFSIVLPKLHPQPLFFFFLLWCNNFKLPLPLLLREDGHYPHSVKRSLVRKTRTEVELSVKQHCFLARDSLCDVMWCGAEVFAIQQNYSNSHAAVFYRNFPPCILQPCSTCRQLCERVPSFHSNVSHESAVPGGNIVFFFLWAASVLVRTHESHILMK